ncbi:MAG: FHA domain-containing protein [Deltaproteobacteria bacterium]|nr:FHA domain-containing protein [Deltaproteobacteria bacterium]
MIRLTVNHDTDPPRQFEFDQDEVLIGRQPPADIVLENESVSRRHARLARRPEGWRLSDLGAPNGLYVQRKGMPPPQRVIVEDIASGDVICIERFHLVFEDLPGFSARPKVLPTDRPEFGETFTHVTTLPGFQVPKSITAAREPPPSDPRVKLDAALALAGGVPAHHLSRELPSSPPASGRVLEVFEEGAQSPRVLPLGSAPIQFGRDPSCDVKLTGLTVPRFVASVSVVGNRVALRRVSTGLLGPKVLVDGQAIREVDLEAGHKFSVGPYTCIVRWPRP